MKGNIVNVELNKRKATVQSGNRNYYLDIPVDKSYVYPGCIVSFNVDDLVLNEILDFPDGDLDQFDPFSTQIRSNQFLRNVPPRMLNEKGGDWYQQPVQGGFMSLMRGFMAIIGGGPLAQLRFYGMHKLTKLVSDNFRWIGNKINIDIAQSSDSGLPVVRAEIGSLSLQVDTDGKFMVVTFADLFSCTLDREGVSLEMLNLDEKMPREVFTYKYDQETKKHKHKVILDNMILETASLFIKCAGSYDVIANEINLSGATINNSATGNWNAAGKGVNIRAAEKFKVNAGVEIHNIGNSGLPGNFQINNSKMSSLRMDEFGQLKIYGATGVSINGMGDFLTNANPTVIAMNAISMCFTNVGPMFAAIPGGQPIGAAFSAAGAAVLAVVPFMTNTFIRVNPAIIPPFQI